MCNKTCWSCSKSDSGDPNEPVTECCHYFDDEQAELADECGWDETIMPTICGAWVERDEHQDNAVG